VEQGRREDDEEEAYREDLDAAVSHGAVAGVVARACARGRRRRRRTKDSPMMVLMPAMVCVRV
jgi:hypothetical protein